MEGREEAAPHTPPGRRRGRREGRKKERRERILEIEWRSSATGYFKRERLFERDKKNGAGIKNRRDQGR